MNFNSLRRITDKRVDLRRVVPVPELRLIEPEPINKPAVFGPPLFMQSDEKPEALSILAKSPGREPTAVSILM